MKLFPESISNLLGGKSQTQSGLLLKKCNFSLFLGGDNSFSTKTKMFQCLLEEKINVMIKLTTQHYT